MTQILIQIRRIVRSLDLESKQIQKNIGISIPQLLCLDYLRGCPGERSTHRDLTAFLNLNSSTVTGIVNRLERKQLLRRLPGKIDKRITHLALTAKGRSLLNSAPDLLHNKLSEQLAHLPEKELQNIRHALELLVHAMGIQRLDASPVLTSEEPE